MRPFLLPADGSRPPELLRDPGGVPEQPRSWNRTGTLALVRTEPTGPDIWVMPMEGDRKARPFLATRFDEAYPRFSPDGKWIAYASNESGDFEIYLRPFPGPGPSRLVSNDGGVEPRWRGDGREIFYRNGDEFLAVDVALGATPTFSLPRVLFKGSYFRSDWSGWDVMPDGQGFVVIQTFGQPRTSVSLVQNWFEELKQP
jgi:serine/threonine-protein kinase